MIDKADFPIKGRKYKCITGWNKAEVYIIKDFYLVDQGVRCIMNDAKRNVFALDIFMDNRFWTNFEEVK